MLRFSVVCVIGMIMFDVMNHGCLDFCFLLLCSIMFCGMLAFPDDKQTIFLYSSASSAARSLKFVTFHVVFEIIADAAFLLFFQKML